MKNSELLAWEAMEAGKYDDAVRLLTPLAHRNSEYALLGLGWIYETGATAAPDKDAALTFYARAAWQGSAAGCFDYGRLLRDRGEETKARSSFRSGAEKGNLAAMSELGSMLLEGRGGPSNAEEGWNWLERAAAQGHFFAQRKLLAIEDRSARSIPEKLAIKLKILRLAMKVGKEAWQDRYSDKLR